MKLLLKNIFVSIVILALLQFCSAPEQNGQTTQVERPSQESWNSDIYLTKLGTRHAKVHAGHLSQYDDEEMVIMNQKVQSDFYRDGEHSSVLLADSAVIFRKTNVMRAFGDVVVESDSGDITLKTPRLVYDPDTEKITSDTTVTLTTETDTLHGIGFESNSDLTEWRIVQPHGVTRRSFEE